MKYELKPLPYAYDALSPVISKEIVQLHYDKHHMAYVNGANAALELLEKGRKGDLVNVKAIMRDLSFNVNGHVMHELFWENMRAVKESNAPSDSLKKKIESSFGSYDAFKNEFSEAAKTVEGSGWAILYSDNNGNLLIGQLEKHNLLGLNTYNVLLAIDVWEHAYYLDYKNDRGAYVENWWQLVNWDVVEKRLAL
ncbi:superoxide dismutase [bacterium]|nr:superoxide dismutase [bacterium]